MDTAGDIASDYEKILSVTSEDTLVVEIYRSHSTGLRIALCPIPGPIVNGYFLLATEAHDDDGLPHTLEHLVFLGSEDYPYKGVLDLLANRCFAQGTNAWTDTDHTVYTVETAGAEGFLNFLPIYVEHILYPTLTDEAFLTEVYHITETGEDAGVVYCEMQGRENSGESRTYLELIREMYPGVCGFKSETGGIMKNLRESTNNEKVRAYHAQYYRPDNLTLIITGQVKPNDIFKTLDPICNKIRKKLTEKPLPKMERPWSSAVPPLTTSVKRIVEFGNDTEEKGQVMLGFRGFKATEIYISMCQQVILDYFTDTSAAPLMQAFVEKDDAICSNVKYGVMEATESTIYVKFSNVYCKDLESVGAKFFEVIKAELKNGLNMERIKALIEKKRLETLNSLEDAPHDSVSGDVIGHILFGLDDSELEQRLNSTKLLERAVKEPEGYWICVMTDLISKPHVEIIGKPSIAEKTRLATEVEERLDNRKTELGEEGLKLKGELLQAAVDANEEEPPDDLAEILPVPDPAKIEFHNLRASSNYRSGDDATKVPLKEFPFIAHLDDIQETQFISWGLLVDISALEQDLKPYVMLWTELFGETSVKDESDDVISYEDVAVGLERDFLHYTCNLGALNGGRFSAGSFPETINVSMKVDRDADLRKYFKGVTWLSRLLFRRVLNAERVKNVIQKILKSVDQSKRSGRHVVNAMHLKMKVKETSTPYHALVLNQEKILQKCIEMLGSQPDELISILSKITQHVQQLKYIRLHLTAAVDKISSPDLLVQPWREIFLAPLECHGDVIPNYGSYRIIKSSELFKTISETEEKSKIIPVGAVESSFLMFSKPVDICSYDHPDIAPLMVLNEYLSATEGPMWRLIRGLGYSYGYLLHLSVETACINFALIKATHLSKAYEKAFEIVQGFSDGSEEFEPPVVDASKSSVMFEVIEREKTIGDASAESMLNHLRQMNKDYNKKLLKKVDEVTLEDLQRVCDKYLSTLFDVSTTVCAVVCHPSKIDEICEEFAKMPEKASRNFTKYESFEDAFK